MMFSKIQDKMLKRVKKLSKLEKDLYAKHSTDKEKKQGYDALLEKIKRHNGEFFFVITDLQTKPRIEISPSEIKALLYHKLILPLDNFSNTRVFKETVIQQIEKENKEIRKRKTVQEKEYARYLKLKKEFEND